MADTNDGRALIPFDPPNTDSGAKAGAERPTFNLRVIVPMIIFIIITSILFGVIGAFMGNFWLWFLAGLVVSVTWTALSVQTVEVDELAGIEFFGRPLREVKHGPHFVPFLIFQLRKLPAYIMNDEFPGNPEEVFKGRDEDFDHESGLFRPIRITAGARNEATASTGPLDVQMTSEIQLFIGWRIRRGHFFEFRAAFGTVANARKHLRDYAEGVVVEKAGKNTMGWIVQNTPIINGDIETRLRSLVGSSGIDIFSAAMKEPDLTRDVNVSLSEIAIANAAARKTVITATADAQATTIAAGAERKRLTEEGAGTAEAERLHLVAKGKGIKQFGKDANVCGAEVLGAEVAENMFGKGDQIVLGGAGGLADVFAAAQVAKKAFQDKPKAPEEDKK